MLLFNRYIVIKSSFKIPNDFISSETPKQDEDDFLFGDYAPSTSNDTDKAVRLLYSSRKSCY